MVKSVNVGPVDIEAGAQATVELLKNTSLSLRAALWWLDEESNKWRFLVATPLYRTRGPKATYSAIRQSLKKANLLDRLSLSTVWAVDDDHPIVKAMRPFIKSTTELQRISFAELSLNDIPIKHAIVFVVLNRLAGPRKH